MARLTRREAEVLQLIGRTMSCKRIASALGISEFTVRKHRASILGKLGFRTTAQLTAHAIAARHSEGRSMLFSTPVRACGRVSWRSFGLSATD
jgi:DNA-binding CsgD family transcriptional regulator